MSLKANELFLKLRIEKFVINFLKKRKRISKLILMNNYIVLKFMNNKILNFINKLKKFKIKYSFL